MWVEFFSSFGYLKSAPLRFNVCLDYNFCNSICYDRSSNPRAQAWHAQSERCNQRVKWNYDVVTIIFPYFLRYQKRAIFSLVMQVRQLPFIEIHYQFCLFMNLKGIIRLAGRTSFRLLRDSAGKHVFPSIVHLLYRRGTRCSKSNTLITICFIHLLFSFLIYLLKNYIYVLFGKKRLPNDFSENDSSDGFCLASSSIFEKVAIK